MSVPPGGAALSAAARCLALDVHAVRVVRALDGAGVPSVLVKGPGLARRLYAPDVGRRRYSDVDVLVRPEDFERAQGVLAALGHHDLAGDFPDDEWLPHERSWRSEPDGLTVDLHRGFAGVEDAATLADLLLGHTEPLRLAGGTVPVPDVIGCALLVALHAAAPGRGRKALLDLTLALQQWPLSTWEQAAGWAAATGASGSFATGLRRLADGAELAQSLALAQAPTRLIRFAERLDLVLLHRSLHAIRLLPDTRTRLRYVARRLVPTPAFLQLDSALARRGRFGLGLAYAARPLRLFVRARRPDRVEQPGFARRTVGGASAGTATRRPHLGLDPSRWRWSTVRTAWWTITSLLRTRRALLSGPLAEVELSAPPLAVGAEATVRRTLARRRATCLERSIVLQRWRAGLGQRVDLVVGVTPPAEGFRAHAWLASDHDAQHSHATMTELLRRPTPEAWVRR